MMEEHIPEERSAFDGEPLEGCKKHDRSEEPEPEQEQEEEEEEPAKRHKRRRGSDRSKSKREDERDEKESKHRHRHHRHKHRRKHKKSHDCAAGAEEVASDRGDCENKDPGRCEGEEKASDADGAKQGDESLNARASVEHGVGVELEGGFTGTEELGHYELERDREVKIGEGISGQRTVEEKEFAERHKSESPFPCDRLAVGQLEEELQDKVERRDAQGDDSFELGEPKKSMDLMEAEAKPVNDGCEPMEITGSHLDKEKDYKGMRNISEKSDTENLHMEGKREDLYLDCKRDNVDTRRQEIYDNNKRRESRHAELSFFEAEKYRSSITTEDEKEEGEILEEDDFFRKIGESEIESGEIKNDDGIERKDAGMGEVSSKGQIKKIRQGSASQSADLELCHVEETILNFPERLGTVNFQSMLGIAEAYDSDQVSEEGAVKETKIGSGNYCLENIRDVEAKDVCNSLKEEKFLDVDFAMGLDKLDNSMAQDERKTDLEMSQGESKYQVGGEREVVRGKDRKNNQVHSATEDIDVDKKGRQSSISASGERFKESHSRQKTYKSSSRDSDRDKYERRRHSPSLEYFTERLELDQRSGSPENARNRQRSRRQSRSPESTDRKHGEKRSCSLETERQKQRRLHSSERERPKHRHLHTPERVPERYRHGRSLSPESERNVDWKRTGLCEAPRDRSLVLSSSVVHRSSRSRDSIHDMRRSREMLGHYDHTKNIRVESYERYNHRSVRSRGIEASIADWKRQSSSRDVGHESRHHRASRDRSERSRRSRSRDTGHIKERGQDGYARRQCSRSRDSLQDWKGNEHGHRRHGKNDDRTALGGLYHEPSRGKSQKMNKDLDGISAYDQEKHISKEESEFPGDDENQEEYQERVASQLAAQEEDDVERIKEESRRRRQAILERYRQQEQQIDGGEQLMNEATAEIADGGAKNQEGIASSEQCIGADETGLHDLNGTVFPSTAFDLNTYRSPFSLGKGPLQNGMILVQRLPGTGALGAGTPKSEKSGDKFCDDIFGESPAGGHKIAKGDGLALDTSGLTDNWDDAEGYYCFRIGEILDGHYEVASSHGRGVFSSVVRARDLKASRVESEEVAIKIIRNNDLMFKAGLRELVILKKLAGADPENRRHCVRFLSSFEYRNHLCLVFESMHMNLREILKKFGRNIGINLNAVRAYAKQLFIALKHLRNCGVLHCDIKPDNMLVNEAKNVLKLCDFGSAMFAGENEITPYLVSRFYRSPEIILGLPYDHALDMWSVGCCLYEFYTGKVLFPGPTNNDMLRLHMELKGPLPKKMLKKSAFAGQHFDQDYNFCSIEEDPVTKKTVKRLLVNVKPKEIGSLVTGSGTMDEDPKMLANFKDLLEKIFILDPDKRLTVSQALMHPFITGK